MILNFGCREKQPVAFFCSASPRVSASGGIEPHTSRLLVQRSTTEPLQLLEMYLFTIKLWFTQNGGVTVEITAPMTFRGY